jgi:hypothetical protein
VRVITHFSFSGRGVGGEGNYLFFGLPKKPKSPMPQGFYIAFTFETWKPISEKNAII